MYTFEERMEAVELYIQSGCSEGTVIRTLGYPSHTALRNWYKEYLSSVQAVRQSLAIRRRKRLQQLNTTQTIVQR